MGRTGRSSRRFIAISTLVISTILLSFSSVRADVVVFDHFDDGKLGSEWDVSFDHSGGWTYSESGSDLVVTDISPTVINPGSGGTWAEVSLSQSFTPLTDFVLNFDFTWDSDDKLEAVQMITLTLRSQDKIVTRVAFHDAWIAQSGEKAVRFDQTVIQTGWNTMPLQGSAAIKVVRANGSIDVFWDGVNFASHTITDEIIRLDLGFYYYDSVNNPIFGSESVDLVKLEGTTPNPIPTVTEWGMMVFAVLLGLSAFFLMRRRRVLQ